MFEHDVECPNCKQSIKIDFTDYVVASDVISEDRGMGAEIEHTIECNDYECDVCKKHFSVNGSVWEYPTGAYNHHELKTKSL